MASLRWTESARDSTRDLLRFLATRKSDARKWAARINEKAEAMAASPAQFRPVEGEPGALVLRRAIINKRVLMSGHWRKDDGQSVDDIFYVVHGRAQSITVPPAAVAELRRTIGVD